MLYRLSQPGPQLSSCLTTFPTTPYISSASSFLLQILQQWFSALAVRENHLGTVLKNIHAWAPTQTNIFQISSKSQGSQGHDLCSFPSPSLDRVYATNTQMSVPSSDLGFVCFFK